MPIAKHKLVNFIISDKRANSVADIFIKKYNFPTDKLITQGVSDSKPLLKKLCQRVLPLTKELKYS